MTTWVVVADSRRARIFQAEPPHFSTLQEIHTLVHPQDYRHSDASGADERRRIFESDTTSHHAAEPRTPPRDREIGKFAREIAQFLRQQCDSRAFDDLALVAAPDFMGALRSALDAHVEALVSLRRTKDFSALKAPEIARHLRHDSTVS